MSSMLETTTFGNLIKSFRTKFKLSQKSLCRGLCSTSALSRYERDERFPEKIVAESLLERLGIGTNQIEFITTDKELFLDNLICKMNGSIYDKNLYNQYLLDFHNGIRNCNKLYRQLFLLKKIEQDNSYNQSCILQALSITDCPPNIMEKFLYTTTELELMIRYEHYNQEELLKIYRYTKDNRRSNIMSSIRLKVLLQLDQLTPNKYTKMIMVEMKNDYNLRELITYFDRKAEGDWSFLAKLLKESDHGMLNIGGKDTWGSIENLIF
jgi:transcriptional regulator with XRE-family HTH domain